VHLAPIRKHRSENGWFAEIFRVDDGTVAPPAKSFELRQLSVASARPFRINAFHIHPRLQQDESWVVLGGAFTVWLVDCRLSSPTVGVHQKVLLSAEDPAILFIPAGVAHGYRAGHEGGLLLYGMNQQFDGEDPNEGRIPWDHFGAELWDEERG
jgi:dTDP-4-dehydrorhamnose 3,5-epimerase